MRTLVLEHVSVRGSATARGDGLCRCRASPDTTDVVVRTFRQVLVVRKVSGTFRHLWNEENYPFDRHVLRVVLENTSAPSRRFVYTADRAGSKPNRDIILDSWRGPTPRSGSTYLYDTVLENPAFAGKSQSDYSRLIVSIGSNARRLSFFTLVAGVMSPWPCPL